MITLRRWKRIGLSRAVNSLMYVLLITNTDRDGHFTIKENPGMWDQVADYFTHI